MKEESFAHRLRLAGASVKPTGMTSGSAMLKNHVLHWKTKSRTGNVFDTDVYWDLESREDLYFHIPRPRPNSPAAVLRWFVCIGTRRETSCSIAGTAFVLGTHHDTTTGKQVVDFCLGARNGPWLPLTGKAADMAAMVFAEDDPMPVGQLADWLQDTGELVIPAEAKLRPGYAFVLAEGVDLTALPIPGEAWETEVYDADGHEVFIEKRRIDGYVHNVFAAPGGRVIAQLAIGA